MLLALAQSQSFVMLCCRVGDGATMCASKSDDAVMRWGLSAEVCCSWPRRDQYAYQLGSAHKHKSTEAQQRQRQVAVDGDLVLGRGETKSMQALEGEGGICA